MKIQNHLSQCRRKKETEWIMKSDPMIPQTELSKRPRITITLRLHFSMSHDPFTHKKPFSIFRLPSSTFRLQHATRNTPLFLKTISPCTPPHPPVTCSCQYVLNETKEYISKTDKTT